MFPNEVLGLQYCFRIWPAKGEPQLTSRRFILPSDFSLNRSTSDRFLVATTLLHTTAARLQSENQAIKSEISRIINEVANTSFLGQPLRPEWCAAIRSRLDIQHLQSNYEELYNRHMGTPHEITCDAHTDILKKYSLLHKSYINLVKGHAVLKDELERVTQQFTRAADVCNAIARYFAPRANGTTAWTPPFRRFL